MHATDKKRNAVLLPPSLTAKKRVRPKVHVDRAWFYRPDFGETGEVFIAFANANTDVRVYTRCVPLADGCVYKPDAARDAWQRTLGFLREHLK